jgi:hypothetical protein
MAVRPAAAPAPHPDLAPRQPRSTGLSYPRRGEPLLPRLLVPLLEAAAGAPVVALGGRALTGLRRDAWNDLTAEESRHLGLLVVEEVGAALRGAPRRLLRRALPGPSRVVDQLPIEERTARLLRRWLTSGLAEGPWTAERYLSVPGFGPRALVDLLAALEGRGGALDGRLRAVARPRRAGTAAVAVSPPAPGSRPLRVHIGGTRLELARADVSAARTAYAIASRAAYNWGAATVRHVADQLEVVAAGGRSLGFVEGVLSAVAGFQWLDREGGWFWFRGRPNRLLADLAKVLAVVARVSATRLWPAVCRARKGPEQPPPSLLPRLCGALPGVRLVDDLVVARPLLPGAPRLGLAEGRLVDILRRSEQPLRAREVRAQGRAHGLAWRTVLRLLTWSPLVEHLPGPRYALIGS